MLLTVTHHDNNYEAGSGKIINDKKVGLICVHFDRAHALLLDAQTMSQDNKLKILF